MATIDPTLREVLRSRLGREPTHKEMCDAATNTAASKIDPALVRVAVDAYDAERCRRSVMWHGGKCEPMSDMNKKTIAPMIAAALGVMRPYRCDDCGVTLPVGLLKSGCPKCGKTMVPAEMCNAAETKLVDAAENLVIAIGMGWDLDGVVEVVRAELARHGRGRGALLCPRCGREVMPDEPCAGFLAPCGRRLARLDQCGTTPICVDASA